MADTVVQELQPAVPSELQPAPQSLEDRLEAELERDRHRDAELLRLIAQLRECFENNFDRTWFSVVIDGIPVDPRTVREIRLMVSLRTLYEGEEHLLWQGVAELETFIAAIKRFLLPVLRERLALPPVSPQIVVSEANRDDLRAVLSAWIGATATS